MEIFHFKNRTCLNYCLAVSWPGGAHLLVNVYVDPDKKWEKGDYDGHSQLNSATNWMPIKTQELLQIKIPLKLQIALETSIKDRIL